LIGGEPAKVNIENNGVLNIGCSDASLNFGYVYFMGADFIDIM